MGLAVLMGIPQHAGAVKAYPRPIIVTQPDGTRVTVRIHGDESFHYVTTIDGFLLSKDKAGYFCYVDYDFTTGRKTVSAQRAHNVNERSSSEKTFITHLKAAPVVNADIKARRPITIRQPQKVTLNTSNTAAAVKAKAAADPEHQYLVILVNLNSETL